MAETVKHTRGPWYATTRQGSWDWLVAQSETIEICQMFHDGTEMNETGEANAKLVAAAPDMLEALLSAITANPDWELITSAIAKAEGRS